MVSSAIWKKHAISKLHESEGGIGVIWSLWKTEECMFFQIARETIQWFINIHEKIMQWRA
jgi:hypothetical protein